MRFAASHRSPLLRRPQILKTIESAREQTWVRASASEREPDPPHLTSRSTNTPHQHPSRFPTPYNYPDHHLHMPHCSPTSARHRYPRLADPTQLLPFKVPPLYLVFRGRHPATLKLRSTIIRNFHCEVVARGAGEGDRERGRD
ncbi:hypothetical protein E2C01_059366 [Portunus trituberculatus]|uniref:Uncharacterized protein n=1 Tax=Portunus trituberculatus TaxID=210409 RepID=A0A5B7H558_PORTR|nr:hypothetical protein [Portunus trituberculatus]